MDEVNDWNHNSPFFTRYENDNSSKSGRGVRVYESFERPAFRADFKADFVNASIVRTGSPDDEAAYECNKLLLVFLCVFSEAIFGKSISTGPRERVNSVY